MSLDIVRTSVKVLFDFSKKLIFLSTDEYDNFITLPDGFEYRLDYLGDSPGNKGGHSVVLRLLSDEDEAKIIKICPYYTEETNSRFHNLRRRFQREIIALQKANSSSSQRIIRFEQTGKIIISNKTFLYYVMEFADNDLANYLDEEGITTQQRILICQDLARGIKELHSLNIYHRDIKHDNMLMCSNQCKIADLGLVSFRDDDAREELGERIGAFGWESPEVMSKYYAERLAKKKFDKRYKPNQASIIDDKSDVFQLGKLFWLIFTGQVPVGQIDYDDLVEIREPTLFTLIYKMLLQNKLKRSDIDQVIKQLLPISKKYGVV